MSSIQPYAALLGIVRAADDDGGPILRLPFSDKLEGRPGFIQGGVIATLLETAAFEMLRATVAGEPLFVPVSTTIDFLRGGRSMDSWATATIRRLGARIANIDAVAWQDDRQKPMATARISVLLKAGG